jgi:hypothetical protein
MRFQARTLPNMGKEKEEDLVVLGNIVYAQATCFSNYMFSFPNKFSTYPIVTVCLRKATL